MGLGAGVPLPLPPKPPPDCVRSVVATAKLAKEPKALVGRALNTWVLVKLETRSDVPGLAGLRETYTTGSIRTTAIAAPDKLYTQREERDCIKREVKDRDSD